MKRVLIWLGLGVGLLTLLVNFILLLIEVLSSANKIGWSEPMPWELKRWFVFSMLYFTLFLAVFYSYHKKEREDG